MEMLQKKWKKYIPEREERTIQKSRERNSLKMAAIVEF